MSGEHGGLLLFVDGGARTLLRDRLQNRNVGTGTWRPPIALFIALLLIAWPLLAWVAARALVVSAEMPHADALAVLSGGSAYRERAERAAQLFKEGRSPTIVLTNDGQRSGWSSAQQRNPFFVEREAEELKKAGVPAERIEVVPQVVSSTYQEAWVLRQYAAVHNLHSVLVVTSAYHSRRALWTLRRIFRGSGIEIGLDTPPTGDETPAPTTWWLSWRGWQNVGGEYLKIVYYRLRYDDSMSGVPET